MTALKRTVSGFELENSASGAHHYRLRQDVGDGAQMVYSVTIHDGDGNCAWSVLAGGWYEGGGRTPEQMKSIERYGAPSHCADSFEEARERAYKFMRKFSGSPGYNGLLDTAAEAHWVHESHGAYGR